MQHKFIASLRCTAAQAIPTGIDMNSPQYQAAAKACGVSLPSG